MTVFCALSSTNAVAHGWTEYPEARQSICYSQGGVWTGNTPNAACQEVLNISGTYPFVQRNEVAINIPYPNYLNQNIVKQHIPDGTLCYANDPQKKGLGIEHTEWTRTTVAPGSMELIYNATAPHNPSFWEIYITKPGVDVSKALTWDNLELINSYGNIPVGSDRKYRMNIDIPDRSGDAVLFTRWQRNDPAGEGFYNCSDITISGHGSPENPENPDVPQGPYLQQGEKFIPEYFDLDSVNVGDVISYDVLNKHGETHSKFKITISEDNIKDWDRLLASNITGYYDSYHEGNVFIGAWHEEMDHYMYFRNDIHANYFNSKDARASGVLSIVQEGEGRITAVITPKILSELDSAQVVHGTKLVLDPSNTKGEFEKLSWLQVNGAYVPTYNDGNKLIIETDKLPNNSVSELTFKLLVTNSEESDETIYSFKVIPTDNDSQTPPDEPEKTTWNNTVVYVGGDSVFHNGRVWNAQWWTQGDEPGTTGEWGVWR